MHAVLVLGLLGMALVQLTDEPLTIRIAPSVSVGTDRFRLDAIAELRGGEAQQRMALGAIELGASPLPGQKRKFTRAQLLTRLRQHGFSPETLRIEMPDTIEITRVAQSLGTGAVEQFARAEIRQRTGIDIAQWRLENPPAESALPEGEIVLSVVGAPRVSERSAFIEIVASVNGRPQARYALRFVAPDRARQVRVRAGDAVQVVVRAGGVVVEVAGMARSAGAEGESIPVYIPETQKTVRARIVAKGRVEVVL